MSLTSKIKNMTLEEKASMLSGKDFWQTQDLPQHAVPSMFLADGPHGLRRQAEAADHLGLNASIPATCFPTAATMANSWDTGLGEKVGQYLGVEAAAQDVNVLLGPGINIKRNPLCGRNFEYFSEDPYLTGKMAAAYIRGIQSTGVSACVKHFAVNNQETRRMSIDSIIDERTLREIYLTGFEMAIAEGKAKSVMSSYNRLNGTYTNENMHLMRTILRDEWGFTGVVITDWGGSNERVAGLIAGNELEMPGTDGQSDRELVYAVKNGLLEERCLDEALERLLTLVESTTDSLAKSPNSFDVEDHHAMARAAAEGSIVLLKNEDALLPLNSSLKLAVVGDFAEDPRYQGAGSSNVNPTKLSNTLEELEKQGIETAGYAQGFKRYGGKNTGLIKEACKLASSADAVLLYIGLDEVTEAEGLDRTEMVLPANQIALIEALSEVNANIIAVLSCGSAIEMPWISRVKALVHGYLGGQAGAEAMLKVLRGEVNPSGKLAESYPLVYASVPSASNFPGGEITVEYREGLFVGYRYFDKHSEQLLFPFGYGLSYSSFEYSNLKVSETGVSIDIRNTSDVAGKEVVQLYVGRSSDAMIRPEKELKGFAKVDLAAGEQKTIAIEFDDKTFRYFDAASESWKTEAGEYSIKVGASSLDIRCEAPYEVAGEELAGVNLAETFPSYVSGNAANVSAEEFTALLGRELPQANWDRSKPLEYNDTIAQCKYARGWAARVVYGLMIFARWFLRKIGKRDLANLIMMSFYNMPFRGIAKMMGGAVTREMAEGMVMIANGRFFKGLGRIIKNTNGEA